MIIFRKQLIGKTSNFPVTQSVINYTYDKKLNQNNREKVLFSLNIVFVTKRKYISEKTSFIKNYLPLFYSYSLRGLLELFSPFPNSFYLHHWVSLQYYQVLVLNGFVLNKIWCILNNHLTLLKYAYKLLKPVRGTKFFYND